MWTTDDRSAAISWVNTAVALQAVTYMAEDSQDEQEPKRDEPSFASHRDQLQILMAPVIRFSVAIPATVLC